MEDDQPRKSRIGTGIKTWIVGISSIGPSSFRLLCIAAGLTAILAIIHFLPFVDPFFVPPYPTQYHQSWNFFALVAHPIWTWFVFGISFLAALSLIAGIRVRTCAIILFLFMMGVIASARPLTSSSASVFCLVMLFLTLMPNPGPEGQRRGWAVLGLRLQVFLIYFCGIFFKLADPAWVLGFPMAGTLIGFSWSSHLGLWVSQILPTGLLNVIGQTVIGVELVAPIAMFLFFPIKILRRAGVLVLMAMHFGMFLLMTLEFFPWIMITALLIYWDDDMTKALRGLFKKAFGLLKRGGGKIREISAVLVILAILFTAFAQTFLPASGIPVTALDEVIAPLNRQVRFDQHWGMFTHTSFDVSRYGRDDPAKTYKTTRLLVKTKDGNLWDPFTGKGSTFKQALLGGASHPHTTRKAISYFYKTSGRWQERGIRAMSSWALTRAVAAGQNVAEVVIYRYSIPVDFSKSLKFDTLEMVQVKLWYRIMVKNGELTTSEQIDPRSIRSTRISLSD